MGTQNLSHSVYPNLPDAPTIYSLTDFKQESPYHTPATNKETFYLALSQISAMAISFVRDTPNARLNFTRESLLEVDKLIDSFRGKTADPNTLQIFVAECGSYVGIVLERLLKIDFKKTVKWDVCFEKYWFSALRFKSDKIYESSPFVAVTKRLVMVLQNQDLGEASTSQYADFIINAAKNGISLKK